MTSNTSEHRQREPELMDDPRLESTQHKAALRALARLNWLTASTRLVWRPIARLARQCKRNDLRVLDIATGSGDIPVRLWQRARQSGLRLEILGLDISPRAIESARQRAVEQHCEIRFETLDLLTHDLPEGFDVVICSLFLHHLENSQAIRLLEQMRLVARRLGLVNDLVRSRANLWMVQLAARLVTRSHVVRTDGPLSVKAAFTPSELAELAVAAGIANATLSKHWPCRMLLQWHTNHDNLRH